MKRVEVEWIDSLLFHDGWQDADFYQQMLDEAAEDRHHSVGYVAAESEKGLILVQSRNNDESRLCNASFIPSVAILNVREWPDEESTA